MRESLRYRELVEGEVDSEKKAQLQKIWDKFYQVEKKGEVIELMTMGKLSREEDKLMADLGMKKEIQAKKGRKKYRMSNGEVY